MTDQHDPAREAAIQALAKKQIHYPRKASAWRKQENITYFDDGTAPLVLDLFCPDAVAAPWPAVILVFTFPLPAAMKDGWGPLTSWAEALAGQGIAAVIYENREPVRDLERVFDTLRQNGAALGVDPARIGLYACSGNVPGALWLMMKRGADLGCAVLNYGYLLDDGKEDTVAAAAAEYGFPNPAAGKGVADLPRDLPLLLVRAGQDHFTGLNDCFDRFVAGALARNLPLSLVNHPAGVHGFDLEEDSPHCREIIRQILAFFSFHLDAAG